MLVILPLLGFAALTVDIGHDRAVRAQLQAAVDAGAHAGASVLDGTDAGLTAARTTAASVAAANRADGHPVVVAPADVVTGVWDADTATFTPSADAAAVNALSVTASSDMAVYFAAAAFGRTSLRTGASAIARRPHTEPAGATKCYLPIGIPSCLLDAYSDGSGGYLPTLASLDIAVNPPAADNAGWARVGASPDASYVRDQMLDCTHDANVKIGDPVGLNNGQMTTALTTLASTLGSSSTTWDATALGGALPAQMSGSSVASTAYGHTYEAAVMVFDGGPDYCAGSGGSFTGYAPLVGFVWAAVYDIRANGSDVSTIRMRLDLSREHDIGTVGGGSIDAGVDALVGATIVR